MKKKTLIRCVPWTGFKNFTSKNFLALWNLIRFISNSQGFESMFARSFSVAFCESTLSLHKKRTAFCEGTPVTQYGISLPHLQFTSHSVNLLGVVSFLGKNYGRHFRLDVVKLRKEAL